MDTSKQQILITEADLYYIVPIHIKDYPAFEKGLLAAGWGRPSDTRFDLYNKEAIYESEAAFLGIYDGTKSPLSQDGICFVDLGNAAPDTVLGAFRNAFRQEGRKGGKKLTFSIKKKFDDPAQVWIEGLTFGDILRIHVSPDKENALMLLHLRLKPEKPQPLGLLTSTNYWLHKTDHQAPVILADGEPVPGYENLLSICTRLLNVSPDTAWLVHPERLLSATYVQVSLPTGLTGADRDAFKNDLAEHIVHLGLSKGPFYEITAKEKEKILSLYENIQVYASSEGFCSVFLVDKDHDNATFMGKSSTTFLKSYLPIFLASLLVDCISCGLLERNTKDKLREESERFRELKLLEVMPVSRYTHLQELKSLINNALAIPQKTETVSAYIDNLREHNRQRQETYLNFLIGFMGVGQVAFAILELSRSPFSGAGAVWKVSAILLSVFFGILSVIILFAVIRSYFKKY